MFEFFSLQEQLEYDLRRITEENHQQYERLNVEYNRLEVRLPEYESSIEISRNAMIHLTSEINTYRCLLSNLVQKRRSNFVVHFGNGIVWSRI